MRRRFDSEEPAADVRAHNQHMAECSFGAEFMQKKRAARGHRAHNSTNVRDANTGEPL